MRSLLHQLVAGVVRASYLNSDTDKEVFHGQERGKDSTKDERR